MKKMQRTVVERGSLYPHTDTEDQFEAAHAELLAQHLIQNQGDSTLADVPKESQFSGPRESLPQNETNEDLVSSINNSHFAIDNMKSAEYKVFSKRNNSSAHKYGPRKIMSIINKPTDNASPRD